MVSGTAALTGRPADPEVILRFSPYDRHPASPSRTLLDWVKALPGRTWDAEGGFWRVSSFGPDPAGALQAAGFALPTFDGLFAGFSFEDLYAPVSMLDQDGRTVLVRPRMAGFDEAQALIGGAGVWDKTLGVFRLGVADVVLGAAPRPGVRWDPAAVEAARRLHARVVSPTGEVATAAAAMSTSADLAPVAASVRTVQDHYGGPVGGLGQVTPFPFQVVASYAVAGGHTLLADAPGVGKTISSLAAAAVYRARRVLVVCPPVVTTHWAREATRTGTVERLLGTTPAPRGKRDEFPGIAVFRGARKKPVVDADTAVVVVSDSTLAANQGLVADVSAWLDEAGPAGVVIYDEAHRMKTLGSARTGAMLDVVTRAPNSRSIALTGTPILASPHELVPMLMFTGHLAPVFGGAGPFLERYCRKDRYGRWHARKNRLAELRDVLSKRVWVRRSKADVLPQLPPRQITTCEVDVSLTDYRKAHREVVDQVTAWVTGFRDDMGRLPSPDERDDYCTDSIRHVSRLRRAAGVAKVPAALEMVREHLADRPDDPIICWAHHKEVVAAVATAVRDAGLEVAVIDGATNDVDKQKAVDRFQEGRLPVLVCSITAAGVGVTLTRGHDALFIESDWTPALMVQAIDRQHRIGQEHPISVRLLVAPGTLDEHVVSRLAEKGQTVSEVFGDTSNVVVAGGEDLARPAEILREIVDDVCRRA